MQRHIHITYYTTYTYVYLDIYCVCVGLPQKRKHPTKELGSTPGPGANSGMVQLVADMVIQGLPYFPPGDDTKIRCKFGCFRCVFRLYNLDKFHQGE